MSHTTRKNKISKRFLKKFHVLTNDLYEIKLEWINTKMRNLVHLKSKNLNPAYVIYKGICVSNDNYIGATKRNVDIFQEEHSGINKISEPSKHMHLHETF